MDFDFTEEQRIFRDASRRFMEEEMAPLVEEAEETETTPRELFTKMGRLGYLCIRAPERYGGAGVDKISDCIFREEMARICQGFASSWSAHSHLGTFPILRIGTEAQIQKYAIPAIQGGRIAAFALTEPNAGSDVKAIQTRARRTKGGYVLSGAKSFSTNATFADHIVVAAYTDRAAGYHGISLLIAERGLKGMSIRKMKKEGIRSSEAGEIVFEDCCIPEENLIGGKEGLYPVLMETLSEGRVGVAAFSVGMAQAALEAAIAYANEREAFGQKIGKFQGISHKIADMAAETEAARCLLYKAAWLVDQGANYRRVASMAKLFASEVAVRVTRDAMQIFGGVGLTREFPVGRYHRDALVYAVGEGTSEIQRNIIAKELGL
jgi:alkylation response protein AidB-like acyl-CoA dehydrogenase